MNRPIARLFGFVVLMFALLVAFTSRWTVFDAKALQDNALNKRTLLESVDIKRGSIYADDDTLLATSVPLHGGGFRREYPQGSLFAAAVGYAYPEDGRYAGLEEYRNSVLTGTPLQHASLLDQLSGTQPAGDNVYTSLDPAAQRIAEDDLAASGLPAGAVIALVPSTGAVKVFASYPTYDPNDLTKAAPAGSQFDNVTESQWAPGSIQKVVTSIAALDTGRFTPLSLINGNSPQTFQGIPLHNDSDQSYGTITLTQALTDSVNTVFANVATALGSATIQNYMYRLGYYSKPPIDLPSDELAPSGVVLGGKLVPPTGGVDIARVGIGEGELYVTPLQMVMVAAAVANHGVLMTPHITSYVTNSDGVIVQRVDPTVFATVMKPSTATAVGMMMAQVVQDGTAQAALAGFNIPVAGKTGTAQDCTSNAICDTSQVWFIAYAPLQDPQIAVAVTLEHSPGFGGTVAAPIARQVIQALLEKNG